MIENTTPNEPSPEKDPRAPRLRAHYRVMESDELTPEERLERIVELLASVCMDTSEEVGKSDVLNKHVDN